MCKMISSDAVIGNFILESVGRKQFYISISKMMEYDELLSRNLRAHDYFTRFDFDELTNFVINYPFFVESIESDVVKIFNKTDNLVHQLNRHFRIGMPTLVVEEMISASKSIFDME